MLTRRQIAAGAGVAMTLPFLEVCRAASGPGRRELASMRRTGEDWTSTWQRALADSGPGTELVLPAATMTIEEPLAIGSDGLTISGRPGSILQAAPGVSFEYVLSATGRRGIVVRGLAIDSNQSARRRWQRHRFMGLGLDACRDSAIADLAVTGTLGFEDVPAVAIAIAGEGRNVRVERVALTACGTIEQPSDGLYISGDDHRAVQIVARGITDTAVVLEGCNRSTIHDVDVRDSSAAAAITNIMPASTRDNAITGLVARNLRSAVTGWVQIGVLGEAGDLVNSRIEADLSSAGGAGPGINVRRGRRGQVRGLTIAGRIAGTGGQGILVDGSDVSIQAEIADTRDAVVQFQPGATGMIQRSRLSGGTFGLLVGRDAVVTSSNNVYADQRFWNVYVQDGGRASSVGDRFGSAGINHHGHARHGALSIG